ncbi:MAG TPA: 50S ribosomal protein L24 [Blastocatellia bacterium]|nr:50S ribosomal protein L24 [Blastocatellia bacterium]
MKIKKNDRVVVISGRDKGKQGRVLEVMKNKNKVLVEGLGIIKKATRPNRQAGVAGGIVEKEAPIDASNVMLIEPGTGKPTRVGYQVMADGKKVRISRKTGAVIE